MIEDPAVFISLEEFKTNLQSIHHGIFSDQEHSDVFEEQFSPFVNKAWEKVLIPQGILWLKDEDFRALAHAAKKMGDTQVFVTDSETIPSHQMTIRAEWNWQDLDKARWSTRLNLFELHAFGVSKTWGITCEYDDFSILGGTPAFMDAFFEAAGGRQRVKERFLSFAASEWLAVEPPTQVKILKSVGWSFSDIVS